MSETVICASEVSNGRFYTFLALLSQCEVFVSYISNTVKHGQL